MNFVSRRLSGDIWYIGQQLPLIEERYPRLERKLALERRLLAEHRKIQGVFEASLDVWPLQMTAALGIDKYALSDWRYR
jgi:hypothetical protein